MAARDIETAGPLGPALVVEDNPLIAIDLAESLAEGGAGPIETCATVACAMAALERLHPAIVVVDVHLADCDDGWAFAEVLPLLGPRPPQVIFATGTPDAIPPRVAALGTVLAKPFDPADLIELIQPRRSGLIDRLKGALGRDG